MDFSLLPPIKDMQTLAQTRGISLQSPPRRRKKKKILLTSIDIENSSAAKMLEKSQKVKKEASNKQNLRLTTNNSMDSNYDTASIENVPI